LIDYQPVPFFTVQSIDREVLINNILGLAKGARVFGLPTILTSVLEDSYNGPFLPELRKVFPENVPINRTTTNPWEDERVVAEAEKTGRRKIVVAGLWTSNCVALPVLSTIEHGYAAYVVADACGDVSTVAHEMAVQRMIQAGAVPITWQMLLLELQRDWARKQTAEAINEIAKAHGGAQGQAAVYFRAMIRQAA
jgi:nicotinamidase-related amidase